MRTIFALPFILACTSFGIADAHPISAAREFFQLKRTAEFFNYRDNASYVEVVGTSFIGLQAAFNDQRTCVYGFNLPSTGHPGAYQAQTRFVCFPSSQYEFTVKKEYCEPGSLACVIDPGGISVGIGNLKFMELSGSLVNDYPSLLSFELYKPGLGLLD